MKRVCSLLLALMLALSLAACGSTTNNGAADNGAANNTTNNTTNDTADSGDTADTLSGIVNTDGSTSMADVMAVLQETFKELHPDVTVNYAATGSGAGIEAVLAGTADIGLSSRALKDEEKEKGAVENIVALDGVAVVRGADRPDLHR